MACAVSTPSSLFSFSSPLLFFLPLSLVQNCGLLANVDGVQPPHRDQTQTLGLFFCHSLGEP